MKLLKILGEKDTNYTVVSNHYLRDENLSLKAMGLLTYLLSQSEIWDCSLTGLSSNLKDGKTSIENTLKELKNNGYVEFIKIQDDKGHFDYSMKICENPHLEKPSLEKHTQRNNIKRNNIERNNIYNVEIEEIMEYMNHGVMEDSHLKGTIKFSYKLTTPKTRTLIISRLKEGFTVDDFKDVIFLKYRDWVDNEKERKAMKKYYRPETIFGAKFESYLQEYKADLQDGR